MRSTVFANACVCSVVAIVLRIGGAADPEQETCLASGGCRDAAAEVGRRARCLDFYRSLPRREDFFRRVQQPAGMPTKRFQEFLARGGIHPRGVVLTSEYYELPLSVNKSRLQQEVSALLAGADWEGASPQNAKQGVASKHFRLTRGTGGDLVGPFQEVDGRLARSPYIRAILSELGGVVGNVALMRLEPEGFVDEHFDMNPYWDGRVRVHIPIWTNKRVTFRCGQRGEMRSLSMRAGRAYLFDNHLGHSVQNAGSSARVHLTVDLVGSRRFWALVEAGAALGSEPRRPSRPRRVVDEAGGASVAIESWRDQDLQQGIHAVADAMAATAAQLGLGGEARSVADAWKASAPAAARSEDVHLVQRLAVERACEAPDEVNVSRAGLVEVIDSVAAIHRLAEADAELPVIGGVAVQ